ncbi:hypothetical protein EMPS_09611 [Entomortierella parvispora]|uniref:Uncharacterized protein n=1 Tax=Entomortierella parvispora TaxID=205924 RepID=A0A9P3HJ59_9FUNG|nr:hypothetical protein EMPS_09611 [Entomortierella parvispora]
MTSPLPPGQITRMVMPPMVRRGEAPQKDQARSSHPVRTAQSTAAAGSSNPRALMPRVVNSPVEQDTVIEAGMVNLINSPARVEAPRVEVLQGSKTDWEVIDALLPDIRRGFKQKDSDKTESKADEESARLLIAQTLLRKDKMTREEQLTSMSWADQYSSSTQEALRKAVGEFQHRDDAAVRYWELYCKNQGFEDGSNFTVMKTFRYVSEYIAPLICHNVGQGQKSSAADVFYRPLEVLARQTAGESSARPNLRHNSRITQSPPPSSIGMSDSLVDTASKKSSPAIGSTSNSAGSVRKWSSPTGTGEPTLSDTAMDHLILNDNPSTDLSEIGMDIDTPQTLSTSSKVIFSTTISGLSNPASNSLLSASKAEQTSITLVRSQETQPQTGAEPTSSVEVAQETTTLNQIPTAVNRLNPVEERSLEDVLCPTQMIPPIPWFTGRRPLYDPPSHRLDPHLKTVKDVLWEYRVGFLLGAGVPRPRYVKVVPPRWPSIKDLCKNFEYQWVHPDDVPLLKSRLAIVKMYLIYTEVDNLAVMEAIQKLETLRGNDDLLALGNKLTKIVKNRFLAGSADNLRYSELPYIPDKEPLTGSANDFYQGTPRSEEGPIWFSSYGAKGDFTERGPLRHPTMVYFPDLEITSIEKIWFEWHQKLTHLQGRDRSYWELPGSSERHYLEFCLRKQIVLSICEGLRIGSVAKVQYAFIELAAKQQTPENRLVGFGDATDFRTAVFVHKAASENEVRAQMRRATAEAKAKKREEAQADAKLTGPERKQKQKSLRVKRLQYVKGLIQEDLKSRIAAAKQREAALEAEQQQRQMARIRKMVRQNQQAMEAERRAESDQKRKEKSVAKGTRVKVEAVETRLLV